MTRNVAFTNATVVTAPGQRIEKATLVVKDGLIEALGPNVSPPPGARTIEADSMFIYAGFIDGFSHVGVPKPKREEGRPDVKDPGNPTYEQAGIQPEVKLRDRLDPGDNSVGEWRKLGFTLAQVAPHGQMLPGHTGLVLLHGDTPEAMLYRPQTGLFAQLEGARGAFPATVIGVMTKFRELYRQAEQAKAHETAYRTNPAGMPRPENDYVLEALYPVLDQELPLVFHAEDVKTAHRVLALRKDLGFPLVLVGLKEGWRVEELLADAGVPVYLSLDLPEAPDEKKEDEEAADPEKERLESRRKEEMDLYLGQFAALQKAGVTYGFALAEAKSKDFKANLRRLMEHGLGEEDLLAALTTTPATMLGLSGSMGTLEAGKMANLVVSDGPYFAEESQVRYVMVDGHLEEYEAKEPSASGEGEAPAEVSGQWSYSIEGTGQNMEGTLTLVDSGGGLEGSMSNPMTGQEGPVKDLVVQGSNLSFALPFNADGETINVYFNLLVDGETFEGTVDAGQYGAFPVEGSRVGDPEKKR